MLLSNTTEYYKFLRTLFGTDIRIGAIKLVNKNEVKTDKCIPTSIDDVVAI